MDATELALYHVTARSVFKVAPLVSPPVGLAVVSQHPLVCHFGQGVLKKRGNSTPFAMQK
jgi:hypothetical protein